ncbi:2-dehydropantoate 2-reductase [Streptococcus constellatus subsp. pharyngis SK1060 = CCUG 46377]|uniref:2-dehydropantoate 2-reductase n=1 Tax=Streptococcus constellatus subsp. pharyngis SK1060 = CCUG 46377 TaxID=1035184 RepID=F9P5Y4_STRCV|nr:2-dehydropantoate 2-reductase [Streptococcus constellatus subsp. pharyngis SK1060 = CCUG 46377]
MPIYLQNEVEPTLSSDLIILFTKAMQLEAMLTDIQPLIKEHTNVLCLLNGIGHEEIIEKYVPKEHIMIGNTMWTAGMEGPGRVKLFGNGTVALKNLVSDSKAKQAADHIVEILNSAGLNAQYSENILHAIYKKACVNGTMNGLCTILLSNMADFGDTTPAHTIVERIVSEFAAVAKYENVNLNVEETVDYIEKNCYNRDTIGLHHPSMYQDLNEHNRLTEIDYINGAVVRKGQKYGVQTPYCSFLTELVHCKEQILGAK